jgi:succinate dehydrogenase / fumarate reductase cytochrome b subunit
VDFISKQPGLFGRVIGRGCLNILDKGGCMSTVASQPRAAVTRGSVYLGGTGMLTWLAHRISGIAVAYFLTLHILEAMQLLRGAEAYTLATDVYKEAWFRPVEFLLVMAVVYHAFNGLRVTLFDLFPQTTKHHRRIFWIGVGLFVVVTPLVAWAMMRSMNWSELFVIKNPANAIYAAVIVVPVALPVLYIAWRGSGLSTGPMIVSSSSSRPAPTTNQFERLMWSFMRLSGLVMVVLIFIHLLIMHFTTDIADVNGPFVFNRFAATPIWMVIDLLILFFAWIHGLNGVRIVLTDYMKRGTARRAVLYLIGAFGVVWFALGAYVLINVQSTARLF